MSDRETTDVAVIGASLGGVLAAWRAAQAGCHVTRVAAHPWLGGQMTAQGVPPDEHPLNEAGGASASYLAFREGIRRLYRAQPGFRDRAILTPGTNPGDGWVSRLCFEPAHAARWFERLLAPACTQGRLRLLRGWQLRAAQRQGPQVTEVDLQGPADRSLRLQARVFVDATDTGELIHQLGLPCRLGKEGRSDFGEPDAPAQRWWVQGVVVAAASSAAGWLCVLDDGSGVIEVLMQDGEGAPVTPVGRSPRRGCRRAPLLNIASSTHQLHY